VPSPNRLLLIALSLLAACDPFPTQTDDLGTIQVENASEAPVAEWHYSYCGDSEVHEVAIATPDGQIPQGAVALTAEYGGSCTDHTFALSNGRSIAVANVAVVARQTTFITLTTPPES